MNGQELVQEIVPQESQAKEYKEPLAEKSVGSYESAEEGLRLLLERLPEYFTGRAERDDIETLVFCLRHLYTCIDTLSQHTLPRLTRATGEQKQAATSIVAYRHAVWVQLQAMLLLLERIESHCHLLLSTVVSVLGVLDTTEDGAFSTETHVGTEQWQRAYEVLSAALRAWQGQHKTTLCFHTTFARVVGAASAESLAQMDTALTLLFDGANAIFGDIIPDVQLVAQGDDEVVATLLFDLMQQNDLLLIQIGKLIEPLQQLIKQYVVTE